MNREDFLDVDMRVFEAWYPLVNLVLQAVVSLQGRAKSIPSLVVSPGVYRLMQGDSARWGGDPLRIEAFGMGVCCDERLKAWQAEVVEFGEDGVRVRHCTLKFNVLGLMPELAGKERLMITVTKGKVMCSLTGTEGDGYYVVLEGPGGATQVALSETAKEELISKLSGLPGPGEVVFDDAPEPMVADAPVANDGGDTDPVIEPTVDSSEETQDNAQ